MKFKNFRKIIPSDIPICLIIATDNNAIKYPKTSAISEEYNKYRIIGVSGYYNENLINPGLKIFLIR